MSFQFAAILALVFLVIWTVTSYFFWRINQKTKAQKSKNPVQPALQLAEQWISESQRMMEELVQRMEQPLSTAQNELLELRLEAGRIPQGIKNLRSVRESFRGPLHPSVPNKALAEMARYYLQEGGFRVDGPGILYLDTSLGQMPCLEAGGEGTLTEEGMRVVLARFQSASGVPSNAVAGGLLYFPLDAHYQACLADPGWMEGLRSRRLMPVDFKALCVLLMSLRLWKDANQVVQVFERGVESTQALTGQSDRMGEALSALSGDSLKARAAIDGGTTGGFNPHSGGR